MLVFSDKFIIILYIKNIKNRVVCLDNYNEQLNNDSDFEIVHMSLRRRAEDSGEHIFETEHFTAIAKGYIVEKYIPDVEPEEINIPDISFGDYRGGQVREDAVEDNIEMELRSYRHDIRQKTDETLFADDADDTEDVIIEKQEYQKKNKTIKIVSRIAIFVGAFVTIFFAIIFVNVYVHRKNVVYGSSMEPTLYEDDVVYTTKLPYFFGEPEIGDIVVIDIDLEESPGFFYMVGQVLTQNAITDLFDSDEEESKADTCWIKRVVAVAGDYVEFKDNKFYRNGELVEEDYLMTQKVMNYPETSFTVEEGTVFCMGDNRNVSKDSRNVGPIPIYQILGKVWKM